MHNIRGLLAWTWRGFLTRLAMVTALIPPPPHRRDPNVSAQLQVDPYELHEGPPPARGPSASRMDDQYRPTPYPPHLEHQRQSVEGYRGPSER